MATFSCFCKAVGDIYVIATSGYLDENAGKSLQKSVEEAFSKGFRNFVLNFIASPVINSQGIAQVIEITELIVEEKKGKIAFTGLSELAMNVFKMVGLFKMGNFAPTEDAALAILEQNTSSS